MEPNEAVLPSPSMIADVSDENIEQFIVDAVVALPGVRAPTSLDGLYDTVVALPLGFQVVYTTYLLEAEVENGGFLQYFYNSSGQFAEEALEGLGRLGADGHAIVLVAAMERILSEKDALAPFWHPRTLDGFFASYKVSTLGEFDDRWYALRSLSPQRLGYIRRSPNDFRQSTLNGA